MTRDEMVDFIQAELTFSCGMDKLLEDRHILHILDRSLYYFYRNYYFSVQKTYLFIPHQNFDNPNYPELFQFKQTKSIKLPCEVEAVTNVFQTDNNNLFHLGISAPNLMVGLGISNQPYLNPFLLNIGELGIYKVSVESFADMIKKLNRTQLRSNYNFNTNILNMLSEFKNDLVLEVYYRIDQEELFEDDLFQRYAIGYAKKQLGAQLGRFTFNLPGGGTINSTDLNSEGKEEIAAVVEEIKSKSKAFWFRLIT